MDYFLIIARSVTQAQHMVRVLEGCGIRAGMLRAPTGLTNRGCSYAVRIRADQWSAAKGCLLQANLRPLSVYSREDGAYREVMV